MIKLELTLTEALTILQALAFAGHYSKSQRGDEFFDLYDKIDQIVKEGKDDGEK